MNNLPYNADSEALQNCAKEAIHQIPLVQAHGFLIACDVSSGLVTFASRNVGHSLELADETILGTCVYDLFVQGAEHIQAKFESLSPTYPELMDLRFKAQRNVTHSFEILAHRSGQTVIIECMSLGEKAVDFNAVRQVSKAMDVMETLHHHKTLSEFLNACALQLRELTQYQRVIIYRFLPDWSGEVVAEAAEAGIEHKFVGLRFPASDIPPQARALYRTNLLRVIGDVEAEPVALDAAEPGSILDQSHSFLRSPSTMHLGYLSNMGVRATMTISLLKDGELWGMVSCHHHKPRSAPVQVRRITKILCTLIAQAAVGRLDAILHREQSNLRLVVQSALTQLARVSHSGQDLYGSIRETLDYLASVLKYQAFGVSSNGVWLVRPAVSESLQVHLLESVATLDTTEELFDHRLVDSSGHRSPAWSPWTSVAILPFGLLPTGHLFLLRQEVISQVHWAGAPSQHEERLPSGLRVLGPRASFESWMQEIKGEGDPWVPVERQLASEVARAVGEACIAQRHHHMNEQLALLGACMANLNDVVVVTDASSADEPHPKIVYVNDAFEKQTGYSREEVIGRSPRFLSSERATREPLDVLRNAIESWKPVTVELLNQRKNGSDYWAEISLVPIADKTGWFTHWVAVQRTVDERKRAELDIQKLIYYDLLTSLPNRRLMMDRLRVALSNAARYERNGALMFIDLDNFKDINDSAGHHVGDELLRQVAMRMVAEVRLEDTVARIGGDEFVVIIEGLSQDREECALAVQRIADKLIACLERPFELTGNRFIGTASLGISLFFDNGNGNTADDLLKQADFAMYQAKGAGKNAWRFYDPGTQAALLKRNALEADLREALIQMQLQVHYQPIFDRTRQVAGFEALLRWNHLERGWVSPVDFIPIAEQSGLIVPIGNWVLETACKLLTSWSTAEKSKAWTIAVNLSARQIRQPDFVDQVLGILARTKCNPEQLKLELTESLLQHDFAVTIEKMHALRATGIRFSIDDFGTGYSSLAYLRRLPISVLKIDRTFVMDIEVDDGDKAICQTILALGRTLKLSIVAEGVETESQFSYLEAHGCDSFQGYLFSKALSLKDLEKRFL